MHCDHSRQSPNWCNMPAADTDNVAGDAKWAGGDKQRRHRDGNGDDRRANRNQCSGTTATANGLNTTCQAHNRRANDTHSSHLNALRARRRRVVAVGEPQMRQWRLLAPLAVALLTLGNFHGMSGLVKAHTYESSTTPMQSNYTGTDSDAINAAVTTADSLAAADGTLSTATTARTAATANWARNNTSAQRSAQSWQRNGAATSTGRMQDSIFMFFARRFASGNELWDGIMRDCYQRPSFSCFQKNVFSYLNDALDARDVNVTQRFKLYRNSVNYERQEQRYTTEAAAAQDADDEAASTEPSDADTDRLLDNAIPETRGRAASGSDADSEAAAVPPETPIEEVTNALYGKSIKFAMTHDVELKLPDMLFDGATFRISPKQIEGNGIIAKLELIPKQEIEARLAGKILKKKIQKFFRSKVLLSLVALVLIIKIIKIKLFWLLPLVIGVGAAKKLLLKFLLFLFPALSHLFKLCSYYQQTFHSTKYHHHHHLINHHHTVVPAWHSGEQHSSHPGPELIYTQPPKGHVSAYLHGAPIHETYGPPNHENYGGGWENSGPGLGSEYISDINRVAQVDETANVFVPHTSDASLIHAWGLGTTPTPQQLQYRQQLQQQQQQQQKQQKQRLPPSTQHHRTPSNGQKPQNQVAPQSYQKTHATSNNFNPFINSEKSSIFKQPPKGPIGAHSAPSPVYTPQRNAPPLSPTRPPQRPSTAAGGGGGLTAAQIAAQYEPNQNHNQQQQHQQHLQQLQQQLQQQLSPEVTAQVKEALRIQAEQRIVAQQQSILEHQPFVQDGQPIMPKNYDPFYSPILQKIDKILEQLGVKDELCKERLVCSMYRDPTRYSPHSNFVSAELSRDTSELEPVTNTNQAVIRFYRLIQAARDGQDQKECLRLYPHCNINTE